MPPDEPSEVTRLLDLAGGGAADAEAQLLALIYDELHALATAQMRRERNHHTLQATALVHEAYLRLMGDSATDWQSRAHFFGAAAQAMRRILVDYARRRQAQRRGGDAQREPLEDVVEANGLSTDELLSLDDALRTLESTDPRKAEIVRLRFFAGLTNEDVAAALDSSVRTVKREWRFARAWLYRAMSHD